jgi:hypothetical protein
MRATGLDLWDKTIPLAFAIFTYVFFVVVFMLA